MKRFKAFWKETGWLWKIFLAILLCLILFVHVVFVAVIPMIVVVFIYFALVRYDDEGNFIGA